MRGASRSWVELSIHVAKERNVAGFSDLYETYFRNYIKRLKCCFTDAVLAGGYSCVVPHTARDGAKFCRKYVDRFAEAGYRIQILAVVASARKCLENGRDRERVRGKQYSDAYYAASVGSVREVVNYCHQRRGEM